MRPDRISNLAAHKLLAVACAALWNFGCASQAGETQIFSRATTMQFENLMFPVWLNIGIDDHGDIRWHEGFDAAGGVRACEESADFECLELKGNWTFAIPKRNMDAIQRGDTWVYNDQVFKVKDRFFWSDTDSDDDMLLIETLINGERGVFHFTPDQGILFISILGEECSPEEQNTATCIGEDKILAVYVRTK